MTRPRGDSVASSSLDGFDDCETDYDVVSASGLSASLASLPGGPSDAEPSEPEPSAEAKARFVTASLSPEDIREYSRNALRARGVDDAAFARLARPGRTVRVYVDGAFAALDAGVVLHLRQAKLAFSSVHLLVGVFPDPDAPPLVERAELLRHVRWVDGVLPGVPHTIAPAWLTEHAIDIVALPEGASVDPAFGPARFAAYERVRELGMVIPTRRTFGLALPPPPSMPSTPVPAPARIDLGDDAAPRGTVRRKAPAVVVASEPAAEEKLLSPLLQRFEDGPPLDIYGIGI